MLKFFSLVFISLFASASNDITKLQMACDIGNKEACLELKNIKSASKVSSEIANKSYIPTCNLKNFNFNKWKKYGFDGTEVEAKKWYCAKESYTSANSWRVNGVSLPQEMIEWNKIGINSMHDASVVKRLKNVGINTPTKVKEWLDKGYTFNQMIDKVSTETKISNVNTSQNNTPVPNLFIWKGDGFSENEARAWRSAGIDRRDAKEWRSFGIKSADDAQVWLRLNVNLTTFKHLQKIGVKFPHQVQEWIDAGVDSNQIEYWVEKGVSSPDEAKKWISAGVSFSYVTNWKKSGISAMEAIQWSKVGINNKYVIRDWKEISVSAIEASHWKEIGLDRYGVKNWIESGILTADEAKAWIAIGLKDNYAIEKWKKSNLNTLSKANKWLQEGFTKGYLWDDKGFTLSQAKEWRDAGISDGYMYKSEGIADIGEALEAKKCRQSMSYTVFNNMGKGILYGDIIQSLPHGYIVSSGMDEIFFVPKFDGKLRSMNTFIGWLVKSKGEKYTYNSVGRGIVQAAKVIYLGKQDSCSKYVKTQGL